MALGAVQWVVECQADGALGASVAPCADIELGVTFAKPVMVQAYVIDPSSASYIDGLAAGFDYTLAGGFFMAGLVTVMLVYVWAMMSGEVVEMVRHIR